MIIKSPGFYIKERDILDKKIEFYYNGIYYNFNSSINEDYEVPNKDIVRCRTFLNIYILSEDDNYFHFLGFSQLDIKVKKFLQR